jgi:hypothetical protein
MTANKREIKKIGIWLLDGETGLSSESMAAIALGGRPSIVNHPHDPSDFRRCVLFLEQCIDPSNRNTLLLQMAPFTSPWHRIAANWFKLMALYDEEKNQRTAPKLYSAMQALKL